VRHGSRRRQRAAAQEAIGICELAGAAGIGAATVLLPLLRQARNLGVDAMLTGHGAPELFGGDGLIWPPRPPGWSPGPRARPPLPPPPQHLSPGRNYTALKPVRDLGGGSFRGADQVRRGVLVNRVVTGYNADGNPAVLRQGEPPVVIHAGRYTTTELWVSGQAPITATHDDLSTREWGLEPPPGGACFRIVEIAPGTDEPAGPADGEVAAEHEGFQEAHATDTLDYVTVLRGRVTLVIGGTEVGLGPGDSVVQQPGVPHDWQNRSAEPCVMVGVLVSAR
jgi:mannose-6-phosphate isomerase-like protein (cupin superfamily)